MTDDLFREPLTRSGEDYLKTIYNLSAGGEAAATTGIAAALDLAPASVSGMIKRLSDQRLVEHTPYHGVRLTVDGRRIALRILRRHRLIETYLVARLGYTWDTVHDEAERLEHAVSDQLIERIAEALGDPLVDPHGDPIPDAHGRITDFVHVPISDLAPGETVLIQRVATADDKILRYLAVSSLIPGTRVRITERQPFNGPVTLDIGGHSQVIGHELAGIILCSRDNG
jgi:DtxR family Mn-dependent transcriptional regulator